MHETWSEGKLHLRIPDGRYVQVAPRSAEHALFGICDAVLVEGRKVACFQAVDWERPARIPPLDRPGALPEGAGTAILNYLAARALASAHGPDAAPRLRYCGPYPTGALFDSLLECFCVADPQDAFARFNADAEASTLAGRMQEVAVDFVPAPFHRVWAGRDVCVQLRDGVEKIYVRGRGYARHARGSRRVRPRGDDWVATIELGDKQWAEIVRVAPDGTVLDGPHPRPAVPAAWCGRPVPEGVRAALRQALPARAPALLRPAVERLLGSAPLSWDDTGEDAAAVREAGIAVHAALLALFADEPPIRLLEAVARSVEPVAQRLAQQHLYRTWDDLQRKLDR